MPPDNDIFSTGILYITDEDGTKTEIGEIKTFDISVDLAKQEDHTAIYICLNHLKEVLKLKIVVD